MRFPQEPMAGTFFRMMKKVSEYLKEKYHTKVYKLSLSSGCTCPNRDGTIGTGGCIFCSEGGSGDFAAEFAPIEQQIAEAKEKVAAKIPASLPEEERKYIAYFQSFTNTYGDEDRLIALFQEVLSYPEIAGISIGTRPDCLSDKMIHALKKMNLQKEVWVELGLQTIHEKTASYIRRGYELPVFADAYERLTGTEEDDAGGLLPGLKVVTHVILGLPGETEADMLETVRYLANLKPTLFGIKLQLLHVLKGTDLAKVYEANPFPIFTLEAYCQVVGKCLQILPKETIIHRLTGDGPKRLLIEPLWSADKKKVMNTMRAYLAGLPDL